MVLPDPWPYQASSPITICDPTKLCEDCGTRFGRFRCASWHCSRYGSEYAQDAIDSGTEVKPQDTGRRCDDCLPKSKTCCGVCKEFLCYVCTELNDDPDKRETWRDWREMATCSYCQQRVCRRPEYGCFYECKRFGPDQKPYGSESEVTHKVVCCTDCMKHLPGMARKWTRCDRCLSIDLTFFQPDGICPACKPNCGCGEKAQIVTFEEDYGPNGKYK